MKVLQVNCVYKKGSTGKIVYDIHRVLQEQGIDSVVCYGRGERMDDAFRVCSDVHGKVNHLIARLSGLMYGGCLLSTNKVIRFIKKEKPDIVHLHCINGYFVNIYRLITWLRKHHMPTVLTLHAEFLHTANCGHAFECEGWMDGCKSCPRWRSETESLFLNRTSSSWKKMRRAFDGFQELRVASVSPWLMERAKRSPILSRFEHSVVLNGIDTDIFKPTDVCELRSRYVNEGQKLIFYATASFSDDPGHVKGGYYVLKLAERLKNENIKILVAAGISEKQIDWPENICFLGSIHDQKLLAQYYAAADVCLLTSKRETFSMPTAESLSCGTPVVGFEAGAPETICLSEYCRFVPYGDVGALVQAVKEYLCEPKNPQIARKAREKYAKENMAQHYIDLYRKML